MLLQVDQRFFAIEYQTLRRKLQSDYLQLVAFFLESLKQLNLLLVVGVQIKRWVRQKTPGTVQIIEFVVDLLQDQLLP